MSLSPAPRRLRAARITVRHRQRLGTWTVVVEAQSEGFPWLAELRRPGDKAYFQQLGPTQFSLWQTPARSVDAAIEAAAKELRATGREVTAIELRLDDRVVRPLQPVAGRG